MREKKDVLVEIMRDGTEFAYMHVPLLGNRETAFVFQSALKNSSVLNDNESN